MTVHATVIKVIDKAERRKTEAKDVYVDGTQPTAVTYTALMEVY